MIVERQYVNPMEMTFIGKDGSMGLRHGKTYRVLMFCAEGHIWVSWNDSDDRMKVCPYTSLNTLYANWKTPAPIVAYVWLILTACFLILPLGATGIYSFTKSWTGILPSSWTLDYYEQVFSDAKFWPAMARGLIISIAPIILSGIVVILALYTAILYDPRLEKYIQSLCMLPYTLKGVILAISVLSLYAGSHTIFSNRIVMLTCVYSIIILPRIISLKVNNSDISRLRDARDTIAVG
ncbi:ABC transporter permease, partial [Angelakisella massiliensis]